MTIIKQFENVRYVINSILLQNNLLAIQRKIEEKNHVLLIVSVIALNFITISCFISPLHYLSNSDK